MGCQVLACVCAKLRERAGGDVKPPQARVSIGVSYSRVSGHKHLYLYIYIYGHGFLFLLATEFPVKRGPFHGYETGAAS